MLQKIKKIHSRMCVEVEKHVLGINFSSLKWFVWKLFAGQCRHGLSSLRAIISMTCPTDMPDPEQGAGAQRLQEAACWDSVSPMRAGTRWSGRPSSKAHGQGRPLRAIACGQASTKHGTGGAQRALQPPCLGSQGTAG